MIWDSLQRFQKILRFWYYLNDVYKYSIPLNFSPQLRGHRIIPRRRMNMVDTSFERSWVPHQENIYFVGDILRRCLYNHKNVKIKRIKDLNFRSKTQNFSHKMWALTCSKSNSFDFTCNLLFWSAYNICFVSFYSNNLFYAFFCAWKTVYISISLFYIA